MVVRIVLRKLATALPLLALLWILLQLPSRLGFPLQPPAPLLPAALLVLLAVITGLALRQVPRRKEVPLVLDRILATRELLTAAVEAGSDCTHPLGIEARRQAARVMTGVDSRKILPLTRLRSWWWTAAASALVILVTVLPVRGRTTEVGREEAAALERVRETVSPAVETLIRDAELLESEELHAAIDEMARLSEDLREGRITEREEALLALDRVDRMLARATAGEDTARDASAVESALEGLANNPFSSELARAMQSGDRERLHAAVRGMADALTSADSNSEEQRRLAEDLADTFAELANALRELGHEDEAGLLDRIASAVRSGDMETARELLESSMCTRACSAAASAGLGKELSRDLLEALNMARYLLGGGKPMPLETASEGCRRPGDGLPSPLPGTGSTNEEGDRLDSGDPLLRDRQADAASSRRELYEALYDSHIIQAESWVDVQAKGGPGSSGAFITETGRSAGAGREVRGSLQFFATAAPGAEERAAELERVPLGYRDVVRRYFSRAEDSREDGEDEGE
jgi:hypothetical protein